MSTLAPDQSDAPLPAGWVNAKWLPVAITRDGTTYCGNYAVDDHGITVVHGGRHVRTWVATTTNCAILARVLLGEIVRGQP
ncbi:MAG: hypothetical protein ACYCT1_05070 [Steroidobacteraceae bacterium]